MAKAIPKANSEELRHEISQLKDQMQTIQRYNQAIEFEMQKGFAKILEENEKSKLAIATGAVRKERVMTGPEKFGYESFIDEVTDVSGELDMAERRFRNEALEFPKTPFAGKKPFYNFGVEAAALSSRSAAKPSYLTSIKTKTVPAPRKESSTSSIIERMTPLPQLKSEVKTREKRIAKERESKPTTPINLERRTPKKSEVIHKPIKTPKERPSPQADKIDIKEYIDEQLKKQLQQIVLPASETLIIERPEVRPNIPVIRTTVEEPKTDKNSLKGTVEDILADMLLNDIKSGPKIVRREEAPARHEPEAYEDDFEPEYQEETRKTPKEKTTTEESKYKPARELNAQSIVIDSNEETKYFSRKPVKKAEEPSPRESMEMLLKQSVVDIRKSSDVRRPAESKEEVKKRERKEEAKKKESKVITNTYVYVAKGNNEVQQLPQAVLSIASRPAKVEEKVKIDHVKADAEAEILKCRIPINVEPLIAGILEPAAPALPGPDYYNPFSVPSNIATLQIPAPHVVNAEDYDVSSTSGVHESSVSSDAFVPAFATARKQREVSEPDSVSEGEIRQRNAAENSSNMSMASSTLSAGEVNTQRKKNSNLFSVEDFSEGEVIPGTGVFRAEEVSEGEVAMSNGRELSEGEVDVNSMQSVEVVNRIRGVNRRESTAKQSSNRIDLNFLSDDSELEEGEIRVDPFNIPK
eukprot:TRINITY_DN7031_c0_g1_i8.p1 TRINITY_DN7031_c0_g1~~TRINITY_DN7031_c0_g1_i8.p1  ORF type:complete len:696 (+),score=212.30 TRINITY_DN7031_c0_g1_i8:140-2227(+)